ncbi:hypothetical protein ACO0LM_12355 [Undibacterium sp. Di26W]|uniref:hypothetical protein n=1 Tax=Undibacterium sp. Di26W TaxID=3413035 RepID=UPI003BF219B5
MTALSAIAMREGFENWSMLMQHSVARPETCLEIVKGILGTARLSDELKLFIANLKDSEVPGLFEKEGSIWIKLDDVTSGNVNVGSIIAMGPQHSIEARRQAYDLDAVLLIDFSGISKLFATGRTEKWGNLYYKKFYTDSYLRATALSAIEVCLDRDYELNCALLDDLLVDQREQAVDRVHPNLK